MSGQIRTEREAYQALEATLLRQLLQASGAFEGNDVNGAKIRGDMFVEALAEAVARNGGLGIAKMMAAQAGGAGAADIPDDPRDAQILADPNAATPVDPHPGTGSPAEIPIAGRTRYHRDAGHNADHQIDPRRALISYGIRAESSVAGAPQGASQEKPP